MLITTHNGLLVNSQHVQYVAIKKAEERPSQIPPEPDAPRHRVVLVMVSEDQIIAADALSREDAEFVRKDIAYHWVEGCPQMLIADSLAQRRDGAVFVEDLPK